MFQVDEKVIADNRTLITIQDTKTNINPITKNGTINYSMDTNDLWLTTPKIRQAYIKKDDILSQYDKIILARNGSNINGSYVFDDDQVFAKNVEVKKNLIVRGDLSVEGLSSVIDTPKLTIEDNVIELNRNEKADGITLNNAGMALNRGTKPFARYLYNEPTKAFVLDTNTSMDSDVDDTKWVLQAHTENSGSNIAGEVRIKEKLTVPIGNITNNLSVANITTSKILSVLETSTFNGAATFNNAVSVAGILTAKNNVIAEKLLNVKGAATFDSTVLIKNALTVNETSIFNKKATFQDTIDVTSIGDQCAIFRKNVTVQGNETVSGILDVTQNANFGSSINVTDQVSASNANISNKLISNLADINALAVKQSLSVTGPSTLTGNVTVSGTNFNVTAASTLTGNTNINGTLGVSEDTTLSKNLIVNQNLTVKGSSNINGNSTITGYLKANNLITENNVSVQSGNGKGLRFWESDLYKIYMSTTADSNFGGSVNGSSSSDYNMYFKMDEGINRGFVFKNGVTPLVQIESNGTLRTIGNMFANGSQVLRQADEGHGNGIDADTLDGLHKTDYVLRDGSQEMTGDLKLGPNKIKFSNDDYFYYDDNNFTIGTDYYTGKFLFTADSGLYQSVIEGGAFKAGNISLSGKTDTITGVKIIEGAFGTMLKSTDEWLRINDDASHTNGVFFGSSTIRTDNQIHIGNGGATLLANGSAFTYKGSNVITAAGGIMTGNLNFDKSKIAFVSGTDNTGTNGMGSSDNAYIYAEHDEGVENSRLVLEVADNGNDAIVLRTSNLMTKKDSVRVDNTKVTFADNPYFGSNRILHAGDMGSGKALDADLLDGKHYLDLQNEFVAKSGSTMTGKLIMNNEINMASQTKITFANANNYIRSGGGSDTITVIGGSQGIYFYPTTDTSKQMLLLADGNLQVLGSNVLRQADYGHTKGIDADKIDGLHLSDLDTRYVNVDGDTMTGDLIMSNNKRFIGAHNYGFMCKDSSGAAQYVLFIDATNKVHVGYNNFPIILDSDNPVVRGNYKIWHENNDGHNSGLDADTLDGKHATDFATSTHNHDTAYVKKEEVNLQSKYKIQYNSDGDCLDFIYAG